MTRNSTRLLGFLFCQSLKSSLLTFFFSPLSTHDLHWGHMLQYSRLIGGIAFSFVREKNDRTKFRLKRKRNSIIGYAKWQFLFILETDLTRFFYFSSPKTISQCLMIVRGWKWSNDKRWIMISSRTARLNGWWKMCSVLANSECVHHGRRWSRSR